MIMEINKSTHSGLNTDDYFNKLDPSEYRYALNVVESDDSIIFEGGTIYRNMYEGNLIGRIAYGKDLIIFTIDEGLSIYVYDSTTFQIQKVTDVNDVLTGLPIIKLIETDTSCPISGLALKNFNGEIIVNIVSECMRPRVINIGRDNYILTDANSSNDILMFPDNKLGNITVKTTQGLGSLRTGSVRIGYRYIDTDRTTSSIHNLSSTLSIPGFGNSYYQIWGEQPNQASAYGVEVTFTGLDTRYSFIEIVAIHYTQQTYEVRVITEIPITSTSVSYVYTGNETFEVIPIEAVLIPFAHFDRIKSVTFSDNRLFAANLKSNTDLDYQQYANNIVIDWQAKAVKVVSINNKQNPTKSFQHGEVYAFYIIFRLNNGQYSEAFHIPGRPLTAYEREPISKFQVGETHPRFMLEDTCTSTTSDTAGIFPVETRRLNGTMGKWQNEFEQYPDTPEFQGARQGGVFVRHHKFPTLNYVANNFLANNPTYANKFSLTYRFALGVQASNVVIPPEIAELVQGYEIVYAKRNYENQTVYSETMPQMVFRSNNNAASALVSNGGNWNMQVKQSQPFNTDIPTQYQRSKLKEPTPLGNFYINYLKLVAFDLQIDRPSLENTYIRREILYNFPAGNNFVTDQSLTGLGGTQNKFTVGKQITNPNNTDVWLYLGINDHVGLSNFNLQVAYNSSVKYAKLTDYQYVPYNTFSAILGGLTVQNEIQNIQGIESLWIEGLGDKIYPQDNENLIKLTTFGTNENTSGSITGQIPSAICTVCSLKREVYSSFMEQELVSTILITAESNFSPFTIRMYEGDSFLCDYGYKDFTPVSLDPINVSARPGIGIAHVHRYLTQSVHNINLRYSETSYNRRFYPKFNAVDCFPSSIRNEADLLPNWTLEQNTFLYNRDYSLPNELVAALIFNPFTESIIDFPYRIIRSESVKEEVQTGILKLFLPINYYESVKNKGVIENIQAFNDIILIHHTHKLFVTKSNDRLNSENPAVAITLGTGDIFSLPPNELFPNLEHYAGTQNMLSCQITKLGYCFVDNIAKKVFIFNNALNEISNSKTKRFFIEHLPLRELIITNNTLPLSSFVKEINILDREIELYKFVTSYSTNGIEEFDFLNDYNLPFVNIINIRETEYYITIKYSTIQEEFLSQIVPTFKLYSLEFNQDNPYQESGYEMVFDEENNRLILMKQNRRFWVSPNSIKGTYSDYICYNDGDIVITQAGIKKINKY
jgi:hypothetical protein